MNALLINISMTHNHNCNQIDDEDNNIPSKKEIHQAITEIAENVAKVWIDLDCSHFMHQIVNNGIDTRDELLAEFTDIVYKSYV